MDQVLVTISIIFVPIMFAVVCHEVAHGYVAWHFGDPTARMLGRLTLNPISHIDLMGTIIVPILLIISHVGILFGWAKPVPVVLENLRNPKRDMVWVAAAGPLTNIFIAVVSALVLRAIFLFSSLPTLGLAQAMFVKPIILMLTYSVHINLLLAVFNMFPIPPLDGGRILVGLLPHRQSVALAGLERYGFIILFLFVFVFPRLGFDFFQILIQPIITIGTSLLIGSRGSLMLGI
ncbi:Zn-dependent protease (includes SpoIVFB) [Trichlorobacter thiogenes]|uniref:Zn-dependent protease (Includes SpoIVFB) n=1 Tax=Trichlorobacter thiogenes TaxID=115783 RepID=A0A1T4S497_9BACT|nr:site-2 protease family protein [Trichlorobacter thiogenes]SKA23032.1 Zn-dependent protease (includes SpoIVFB) [Trichlorobacter thiogenes]